ncbi:MAG: hypothetical protein PHE21_03150 [Candidatus Dojkabacteria bacterium]|nr:hypothetical protein [Candidatus Dojkabacteria bacterium]
MKLKKNKDFQAIVIMFGIILLFFLPVLLKGWVIFPDLLNRYRPWMESIPDIPITYSELKSDYVDGTFPYFKITKDFLTSGDIPLWIDTADLGRPLAYGLTTLVSPLNLFLWLFPIDIGFTISIIIKVLLGALGSYLWLRRLKISRTVSLLCSVVFVFTGFSNSWLLDGAGTINLLTPWIFLLVDKIIGSKTINERLTNSLLLAFMYSFLIFSGFFSGVGYVMYLSSLYVLIFLLWEFVKKKKKSIFNFMSSIKPGFYILASIILAVGISFLYLYSSAKEINYMGIGYRKVANAKEFLPLKTGIQLLFPNFFGNPVFGNWVGHSNWNETSNYVTIVLLSIVPFSIVEMVRRKNRKICILLILLVFCVLMIWKITPLLDLVSNLPIFDSSSSVRLLGLLTFFLVTLGAWGLNSIFKKQHVKTAMVFVGILLSFSFAFAIYRFKILFERGVLQTGTLFDTGIFSLITIFVGLSFLFYLLILLFCWQKGCISKRFFSIVVGFLLVFDIGLFSFGQTPMVPRDYFYPDTEVTTYLSDNLGNGRLLVFDGMFMISGSQLYYGLDTALTHNMHTDSEKDIVALFSQDAWASPVAPMLKSASTDFSSPIFDFYGVKYIVVDPSVDIHDSKWQLVLDNQDEGRVYENLGYVDTKYWVTFNYQKLDTKETFFENMEHVSNREWSFIEGYEPLVKSEGQGNVDLEIITDKSDFNEIRVCIDSPGVLNVREVYWPGWRVTVNGEEADVLQTNYIYRGVLLKPGCNLIVEEYRPKYLKYAGIVSVISISITFLLGCLVYFYDIPNGKIWKITRKKVKPY